MRIILFFLLITTCAWSQEIKINPDTSLYEYSAPHQDGSFDSGAWADKLTRLGYQNLIQLENGLRAEGSFSDSVAGQIVVLSYSLLVDDENIVLSNIKVTDRNHIPANLETIPYTQKRWVRSVNKRLPAILKSLQ